MRALALPLLLIAGCASVPPSDTGGSARYLSASGQMLSFESDSTCIDHLCVRQTRCSDADHFCVGLADPTVLVVPKDIWATLPNTVECRTGKRGLEFDRGNLTWEFGEFRYEAWPPSGGRIACGASLMGVLAFLGREVEAVRITVLRISDTDAPQATFLYSPELGIVAIEHAFAGADGEILFEGFWLASPVGIFRAHAGR